MKVFVTDAEINIIDFITRFNPVGDVRVTIIREFDKVDFSENYTDAEYTFIDGYLKIRFLGVSFTDILLENSKYTIEILNDFKVIYRGKAIATVQTPQDYKITNGAYIYE